MRAPSMESLMTKQYGKELGARLRAIRQQQGLSLHGVEQKSKGRWKAVVIGSYERGDRAVTVQKLAELASFYGFDPANPTDPAYDWSSVDPYVKLAVQHDLTPMLSVFEAPDWAERSSEGPVGAKSPDPAELAAFGRAIARRYSGQVMGLPRIRLHDLRHTIATLGLASGESLKEVSARLGHANLSVTADLYAGVTPELAKRSAQRLAALLEHLSVIGRGAA